MNSELPEVLKNDITNYQISQSKLLKVTEKLQIFLHNLLELFEENQFKVQPMQSQKMSYFCHKNCHIRE